jgi:hypothetical protein
VTDDPDPAPSPELPAAELFELLPHAARSSESIAATAIVARSGLRDGSRRERVSTVGILQFDISTKPVDKIE